MKAASVYSSTHPVVFHVVLNLEGVPEGEMWSWSSSKILWRVPVPRLKRGSPSCFGSKLPYTEVTLWKDAQTQRTQNSHPGRESHRTEGKRAMKLHKKEGRKCPKCPSSELDHSSLYAHSAFSESRRHPHGEARSISCEKRSATGEVGRDGQLTQRPEGRHIEDPTLCSRTVTPQECE